VTFNWAFEFPPGWRVADSDGARPAVRHRPVRRTGSPETGGRAPM